ncbi:hypothetical protein LY78DRAFT_651323 [Colletotrichum sublineola]|nr:hypothetical protein LY78DRAFT_651323 [Colletotrichum sublineola]
MRPEGPYHFQENEDLNELRFKEDNNGWAGSTHFHHHPEPVPQPQGGFTLHRLAPQRLPGRECLSRRRGSS